jgi:DNA-directed RNA polymerase subunit K/omega
LFSKGFISNKKKLSRHNSTAPSLTKPAGISGVSKRIKKTPISVLVWRVSTEEDPELDINDAALFMRINIAAQRARQIMQGAPPRLHSNSRKPAAIAIQELNGGYVEAFLPSELPDPPEEALLADDDEGAETNF